MTTNGQTNAVIKRNEKGQFIERPSSARQVLTSDEARDMVKKRVEKYRQAALRRIVGEASSIDPTVSTSADAFGLVASKQFVVLMDSEKPAIDQLDKLRRIMTGDNGDNSERSHVDAAPGFVSVSAQTLIQLAAELEKHTADAVARSRAIDATIQDAE